MEMVELGSSTDRVGKFGLGCMGMSGMYGPSERAESIATIHAAMEAGVTLLDTGDFYGMGHNELLICEALKGKSRDQVQLSVKFGALRDASGMWNGFDGRPAAVKNFLAYSLNRLGVDYIDIYRPARLDPHVPIEDTIGAIAEMVTAGYVRHIGLSEVGSETIRKAAKVHPICDVQMEYSLLSRGIENRILPACRELGISITAYGILSRGLISGHWQKDRPSKGDIRSFSPRFQDENIDQNLELVEALKAFASLRGVTVAQVCMAFVAGQGADIIPLIGARKRDQLAESLGAQNLVLSSEDLEALNQIVPKGAAAGPRYAEAQMAHLDSEKN